ncbi:MAG TPA: membrane protein insertase YidC [Dermatophilaceae bacterium]|nr:membrane protein insertase YidC [Dermatophilaceae bacterium]
MERSFWEKLMWPLEWFVEWVLTAFHSLFTAVGLSAGSGWTWALSIVGLVVVVRILLIPLFVKQIHASRGMQLIQPEMQKIQAKFKGKNDPESRQAMTQETMALYKRTGTNPFSSCMPLLIQSPFFFALFSVLNNLGRVAAGQRPSAGPLSQELAAQANNSSLFGASLSSTFLYSNDGPAKILTVVLIVLMSVTTFTTQHQLMRKNMPASALDNPFAQQQKIMLYVLPLVFAVSGVNFPIGVLIYWLVTNLWTMCQQFYVIKRMPAPGSPAEKALMEKRKRQGKEHKKLSLPGLGGGDSATSPGSAALNEQGEETPVNPLNPAKPRSGQRQQPTRKKPKRR